MPLNGPRPLLLASVTDPNEALTALEQGVDVLDLKDPRQGSLGACPPAALRAVVALRDAQTPHRVAVSAALGEATGQPGTWALAAAGAAACGVDYLKVGLPRIGEGRETAALLSGIVEATLSASTRARVIAVAYADARPPGGLEPRLVPRLAQDAGASGCLIDTARKDGRTLLDHMKRSAIAAFVAECRDRGLLCGLAGSVRRDQLETLAEIGPDVIGVRGDVCVGGREGRLDPVRLRRFAAALRRTRDASASPERRVPKPVSWTGGPPA